MHNIEKNNHHHIRHEELMFTFEHMVTLIRQMSENQYHSMDTYLNNCLHLHTRHQEVREILAYGGFTDYIIRNDPQLYYNLQSMILSFKVISNLINNLNDILKKKHDTSL